MLFIDKSLPIPIYEQIYEGYKKQILAREISPGSRLPATRKLAMDLMVGRNTVDNAYQQLLMEGYVTARAGSGYMVNDLSLLDATWAEKPLITMPKPLAQVEYPRYDFGSGRADTALFPAKVWKKCLCDSVDRKTTERSFFYPTMQGEYALRKAIHEYLLSARGINCQPDNIVITSGLEYSIERILGLFDESNPLVAMENPGYHSARQAFYAYGCPVQPIPIDGDGIHLGAVRGSHAKLLYVTPSHQFPTGAVLPIKRRIEAIEWAAKTGAYILEDDYDSELRYNAKPIPSMFSIDRGNRTIYMGTFSKSLSPSIRVAFFILPDALMKRYLERYRAFHNSVASTVQTALADFISSGHYGRYVDRLRTNNRKKNSTLIAELNRVFGSRVVIRGAGAGQHVLVDIHCGMNERELLENALHAGIKLHSASKYWMSGEDAAPHQVMMGYGGININDIGPAIELLYRICFPEEA